MELLLLPLVYVLPVAVVALVAYVVIRRAVRDGILDAHRRGVAPPVAGPGGSPGPDDPP